MSDRFFITTPIVGDGALIEGPEAHHLLHVMRAKAGTRVTLFDDSGAEFDAEIARCGRAEAEARILARREIDCELPFALSVAVSLPKGDRQKWLVEKLTELGVSQLMPLETERGVAQPTASALERLRRSVVEAAKQCGRNRLLRIAEPQIVASYLAAPASADERRWIAHPNGAPLAALDLVSPQATRIAIGPEGGFTEAEVAAAAAAGWQRVGLGPRILRVETAAVALASAVALR